MKLEEIAKIAYSAVRAHNQIGGDYSQPEWDRMDGEDKGFWIFAVSERKEYPNAPYSALHDKWLAGALLDGWRHGAAINRAEKLHPKLIPFSKLPADEQRRDMVFAVIVDALLKGN
jgi:hypothetical protein